MDEKTTNHFRQLLLNRQAELQSVEQIGHEAAATVELDQSAVGRLSRMDAMQAQAVSQEMEQRRTLELQRIKAALACIESGDYGYCLRCDESINPHRLEIDPSATLCIQCAEKS